MARCLRHFVSDLYLSSRSVGEHRVQVRRRRLPCRYYERKRELLSDAWSYFALHPSRATVHRIRDSGLVHWECMFGEIGRLYCRSLSCYDACPKFLRQGATCYHRDPLFPARACRARGAVTSFKRFTVCKYDLHLLHRLIRRPFASRYILVSDKRMGSGD